MLYHWSVVPESPSRYFSIYLQALTSALTSFSLFTDRLLPPLPVCGHYCSLWGGCDRTAARHWPNVAPLQQPLHAHEWRTGATQGIIGQFMCLLGVRIISGLLSCLWQVTQRLRHCCTFALNQSGVCIRYPCPVLQRSSSDVLQCARRPYGIKWDAAVPCRGFMICIPVSVPASSCLWMLR